MPIPHADKIKCHHADNNISILPLMSRYMCDDVFVDACIHMSVQNEISAAPADVTLSTKDSSVMACAAVLPLDCGAPWAKAAALELEAAGPTSPAGTNVNAHVGVHAIAHFACFLIAGCMCPFILAYTPGAHCGAHSHFQCATWVAANIYAYLCYMLLLLLRPVSALAASLSACAADAAAAAAEA